MSEDKHTVLCVDDEKNILNSIKRLLYKEEYHVLTASSGAEGLELLKEHQVHLVISDQRMPEMSGTDFLSIVKEHYPDIIRVILTGYTDMDLMAESVNKGHVYKFFMKPWEDQSFKLEIKKALDHYDLHHANRMLHNKILEQNEELKTANDELEMQVRKRTETLEIQNQLLELSRAMLEDIPVPVIGVSQEGIVAFINRKVEILSSSYGNIEVGKEFAHCFPMDLVAKLTVSAEVKAPQICKSFLLGNETYDIEFVPLSGRFSGKGVVVALVPQKHNLPRY